MGSYFRHFFGFTVFAMTYAVIVVANAAKIDGHRAFYEMRRTDK